MKLFIKIIMSIFCISEVLSMGAEDMLKNEDFKKGEIVSDNEQQKNMLLHLKNGLDDSVLTAYYQQDIDDVKKFSNSDIQIEYYDVDLNGDGWKDKIVTIRSPLHSGAMGDSFQILLNDGIDNYEVIYYGIHRFYVQNSNGNEILGVVHLLNNKTNGFYDIEIISEDSETIIQYEDGRYR